MPYDIGPKIGIDGEAEFRKQLTEIGTGLKTLGSEMKVVTSEFIGQEKSMESLTAQNDVLERTVLSLNDKLELQKKMLQASAEQYGEADARTQKWQQAVNATTAELNKAQGQIRQNTSEMEKLANGMDEASEETKDVGKSMDEAGKKSLSFADILKANLLSDAIIGGIKALGNAVKGVISGLSDAAYAADDLNTLAKQTGLSTEELQKYQYAADMIDVSLDTLTGSMSKLTKQMATASKGSGDAYEAFKKLGVEISDQNGNLRNNNDVFNEAIAALGAISNETERDALAMQIFGKSAQDLNPLILGGADALKELGEEAEAAGLILSQESLDKLNLVSDAMDRFKSTTANIGGLFLAGFAEPLANGLETVTSYIQRLTSSFAEGGFDAMSEELSNVVADMSASLAETLPKMVESGSQLMGSIVEGIQQVIPILSQVSVDIVGTIVNTLMDQLPEMLGMAAEMVTTLATGIADALPRLIPSAVSMVLELVTTLLDNVDALVDAAVDLTMGLAEGMINALPILLEKAPEIITKLVTALVDNVPKLLGAAAELIGQLVVGLVENLPEIGRAAGQIVAALGEGILDLAGSLWDIGVQIVSGVWKGIKDKASWFKDQVKGFFSGIVGGVKDILGIQSYSRVSADIGGYMAEGLGEEYASVKRDVERGLNFNIAEGLGKEYASVKRDIERGLDFNAAGVASSLSVPGLTASIAQPNVSDVMADMLNQAQAAAQTPLTGTIVINITETIDGQVLAQNQYSYNISELTRMGDPLVQGV